MSTSAADRARRLNSVKDALFKLGGAFSYSLFWDTKHTVPTIDEFHDDHVFDHQWAFSQKLSTGDVRPINLGSAQLKIFEETVKVLLELFSMSYVFPEMNIRREAHARISFALGRAIQNIKDADFTGNALTFIVEMIRDDELKAALDDALLESAVSRAYDPTPFIEMVPESSRSLATKALLSGLTAPEDASTVYFPVQEWVR